MRLAQAIAERASASEPSRNHARQRLAGRAGSTPAPTASPIGVRTVTTMAAIACASASMPV